MAEIIDARVKQKTGTAAEFAGYQLLAGEIALVRTSANGAVWNFKVGPGLFDSLDWSLQNPGAAQKADTSTVFPVGVPGLYIPTESGTYEGITVDLSVGYVQLIWDGSDMVKAEFPIDLGGYQPQTLLSLHSQWAYDWMSAAAGRDYTYDADGYLSGGSIRWPDGVFGDIDNIVIDDGKYESIRFNRPPEEGTRYITLIFEYSGDNLTRVQTQGVGY